MEEIEKNLENAPDRSYEIGIIIGTYLPFIVLVILAFLTYNYFKNKGNELD